MEIQHNKRCRRRGGEEGKGIRREETAAACMEVREERYGVLILSDSLSMQITTITGNAWALAPANCHSNNKGGLPFSGEAN